MVTTVPRKRKTDDTQKKLDVAFGHLSKMFGGDSVRRAREYEPIEDAISTRYPDIDCLLGCGGIPRGKIVEVYGPEASGKTWFGLNVTSSCLLNGEACGWVDAEQAFPIDRLETLVKGDKNAMDRLLIIDKNQSGEDHLKAVESLCLEECFSIVCIDSVASLVPKKELDGEIGDVSVGLQARMMSQALRKLVNVAADTNTTIIFVNQVRQKIGVMYGNPETTSAGNALKFYSSLRLRVQLIGGQKGRIERDGELIGGYSKVKVVKTRFGPPMGECIIPIYYIDYDPQPIDMIFDLARSSQVKLVKKYKGKFKYRDLQVEGEDDFKTALPEAHDEKNVSYVELLLNEMKEMAESNKEIKIHPSLLEWKPEEINPEEPDAESEQV